VYRNPLLGRRERRIDDEQESSITVEAAATQRRRHAIETITKEPFYNYDPKNFVQADNHEKLTLPPGPNNPVGSIWIGLTDEGYGIHGTPEPSKIDKTGSHGCVRLTNWDTEELATLVEPGVLVSFLE
jgi:lipoprotein-anchoring transpeptidase ErfK/SrfK